MQCEYGCSSSQTPNAIRDSRVVIRGSPIPPKMLRMALVTSAWTYNRVAGLGGDRGMANPATSSQKVEREMENRGCGGGCAELQLFSIKMGKMSFGCQINLLSVEGTELKSSSPLEPVQLPLPPTF